MMVKSEKKFTGDYFIDLAISLSNDISEVSTEINNTRRIPDKLLNNMTKSGFFRLLIPNNVGGHEIDFIDYLEVINIISMTDASVAWCLNQNNVLATLAAFMSEKLALEIWSDPDAVLSNGPPVDASAQVSEKGYILNGRWDFSSGFPHATWLVALAPIIDPLDISNDSKEMRNLLLRKDKIEVIDVWDVNGLRGTGSFSFMANDVHVDYDKTFIDGGAPIQSGSLYLIPKTLLFAS